MIPILGEKSLSLVIRYLLNLILAAGAVIYAGLPFIVRYFLEGIFKGSGEQYVFLLILLYISGFFALWTVFELRRIFKMLNLRQPFAVSNAESLKRISLSCFIISAVYTVKIIFYNSFLTMVITMVFIIAGLFSVVLAEVFRQAAEVKQENDLTI